MSDESHALSALRRHAVDLERAVDTYLRRIHQLEVRIAVGEGEQAPASLDSVARELLEAKPTDDGMRYLEHARILEAEVRALQWDNTLKEREIVVLAAAAADRSAALERHGADTAELRAELEAFLRELEARASLIEELSAAAEQRLKLLEDATAEANALRAELAAVRQGS